MFIPYRIGGTVGAIVTCPLELIKVRFQSSQGGALSNYAPVVHPFTTHGPSPSITLSTALPHRQSAGVSLIHPNQPTACGLPTAGKHETLVPTSKPRVFRSANVIFKQSKIIRCMVDVCQSEGYRALFKGLVPTLVGVLPSR